MKDDEKSQADDVLTKVARTVGTALGTVTSAAAEIVGGKDEKRATTAHRHKELPAGGKNQIQVRQRDRMKVKRAKHRRKLHRKTKG